SLSLNQALLKDSSHLRIFSIYAIPGHSFRTNLFRVALLPLLDQTREFHQQC
ncbi:hypothetical protein BDF14DRAFT_1731315, partial [Spinellus fusiger]